MRFKITKIFFIVLYLFVFAFDFARADIKQVGWYWDLWGWMRKVVIDGNFAYVTMGESDEGIQILDISDIKNPKRVGGLSFGWIYNIAVKDNIAYCGPRFEKELVVYDCADKAKPKVLTKIKTESENINPVIFGDILLVREGMNTSIYEIKNVKDPKLVKKLGNVIISNVEDSVGYGYYIKEHPKETLPKSPLEEDKEQRHDITRYYVYILDLKNPENPVVLSEKIFPEPKTQEEEIDEEINDDLEKESLKPKEKEATQEEKLVFEYGHKGFVYLGWTNKGIEIYKSPDFRKPVSILKLWEDKVVKDEYCSFQIEGNYAYFVNPGWGFIPGMADEFSDCAGLWIIDIKNPEKPEILSHWGVKETRESKTPIRFEYLKVQNGTAYIVDSMFGLRILDATDPSNIRTLSSYKAGGEMVNINLTEKRAYVSEYLSGGMTILDITDRRNPKKIGYFHTGGYVYHFVNYKDDYLYFFSCDGDFGWHFGFYVLDVRDPVNPQIVFWQKEGIFPISIHNKLLLTGDGIYSLEKPEKPEKVSSWNFDVSPHNLIAKGNYVYYVQGRISEQKDNFRVIDIFKPEKPRTVASLTLKGDNSMNYRQMEVCGNYLYVGSASKENQISIMDISEPTQPKLIGEYGGFNGTDSFLGFHVKDKHLYTFRYYAGKNNGAVYDISNGFDAPKLLQTIPGYYSWDSKRIDNYIYVVRLNGIEVFEIEK